MHCGPLALGVASIRMWFWCSSYDLMKIARSLGVPVKDKMQTSVAHHMNESIYHFCGQYVGAMETVSKLVDQFDDNTKEKAPKRERMN